MAILPKRSIDTAVGMLDLEETKVTVSTRLRDFSIFTVDKIMSAFERVESANLALLFGAYAQMSAPSAKTTALVQHHLEVFKLNNPTFKFTGFDLI